MKTLYNDKDIAIMKTAADSLNRQIDRISEIMAYCKEAGISRIGIANCASVNKEAEVLEQILAKDGFSIERVHCKYGKLPLGELLDGYKGIACNPAGQAQYLKDKKTQLNIAMGLCVGHDIIFNEKSGAPVTTLVVKDRKLMHKTVEMLLSN